MLAWKHLQLQEGFGLLWAQVGHGAAQLHDAAAVTAIADHLEDACSTQAGMLIEGLANEPNVRIDHRCAKWLCVVETLAFDGIANRIGMNAEFTGNGADFPVFDIEVAANPRASFRTDHQRTHFLGGVRGNGSTKRPTRRQNWQRRGKSGGVSGLGCGVGDFSPGSTGPHSNDAGDVIEWEP